MPLPDDPDDRPGFVPPVHPDDRLWRHPSEMAAARRGQAGPAGGGPPGGALPPSPGGDDDPGGGSRSWGLAAASVVVGVAATLSVLVLAGAFDRPVRTVIETVDAGPTAEPDTAGVASTVGPAIVRVDAVRPDGTVEASGVVVRADGHVLTTADAVADASQVTVTTAEGAVLVASVVGVDRDSDLAVVDVDAEGMRTAEVGDVASLRPGTEAVAVARVPDADTPTVSAGRVSALGLRIQAADGSHLYDMIEAALELSPSAAGAVLCSLDGAVLGVVTDRAPADDLDAPGGAYTATSLEVPPGSEVPVATTAAPTRMVTRYATPIDYASAIADDLIRDGTVDHAWLGVLGEDLDPTTAAELGRAGARLTTVREGGPAEEAGLAVGDVVVALDGAPVASVADLVVALRERRDGDVVTVRYLRDGEAHRTEATLTGSG